MERTVYRSPGGARCFSLGWSEAKPQVGWPVNAEPRRGEINPAMPVARNLAPPGLQIVLGSFPGVSLTLHPRLKHFAPPGLQNRLQPSARFKRTSPYQRAELQKARA